MDYLKKFDTKVEYDEYIGSDDVLLPNVSKVKDSTHYKKQCPSTTAYTISNVIANTAEAYDTSNVIYWDYTCTISHKCKETVTTGTTSTTVSFNENTTTDEKTISGNILWNNVTVPYYFMQKGLAGYTAPVINDELVYNAISQPLVTDGSTTDGTMYYSTDNSNWSVDSPSGTNAASYTIYYKIIGDEIHSDLPSTLLGTATIAKVTPTVTAPTAITGLIYNGSAQGLITTGSTDWGTLQYSSDGTTWGSSIPSGTNATSYTVYYKVVGDSNINDVASTSISNSIAKVTPTVTAPTAVTGLTYNTSAQTLVNEGSTDYGTLQYKLDDGSWGTAVPSATNATSYTVYYKVVGDSNINDVAEQSISVSIAKVTPTVVTPTAKVLTFNSSAQTLVNEGSTDYGTLEYELDDGSWSTTVPSATHGGSYVVSYKVVGDSNINDVASATVNCSISEKPVTATVTLSQTAYTYNGTAFEPTPTVYDGGTVIDPSEYSVTYSNNTNAGTGTCTISDNVGGDYNVIGSATFTIDKVTPTVTAPTAVTGLTYNGSTQALVNAGSTDFGTLKYSLDDTTYSTDIPSGTNATSYTVYYKVEGDSNVNEVAAETISVSIDKAAMTYTAPSAATRTYNGSAQQIVSGGSATGGSIYYATSSEGASSSTTVPTQTNASTSYSTYWKAVPDSNHSGGTSSWTQITGCVINKASQSAPSATGATVSYGSTATARASGGGGQGSIQWSNGSTRTAVGSQTTQARWSGNDNYNASSYSSAVTLQVNKASQSAPTAYGSTVTYGSTASASASGGGGQGSIEWSNGSSRSSVGSQSTQARWSGNGNYNASSWSNSVTLQVNKANSSIYFSGGGSVTEGGTMTKAVTRSAGDGSISYSSSNTAIATVNSSGTVTGKAAGSCTIYASIAATTNYNSASASYTLTVSHPTYNGYAYVDLGLSCKWAVCNVGASSETAYGTYYKGNTDNPKNSMGGSWRLPTKDQFNELINNCTHTWTSIGGVNGMKFSRNNRYVFFPAAGSGSDTQQGSQGRYWSITKANSTPEYNRLYFDSSTCGAGGCNPPKYKYPNRGVFT